jgi:hypothetical protein
MHIAASEGNIGAIRILHDLDSELVRVRNVYNQTPVDEAIEAGREETLCEFVAMQVLDEGMERQLMYDWIRKRRDYFNSNPNCPKHEDICSITQDNIIDLCVLKDTGKSHEFKFERHILLEWLLINQTNPMTRQQVSWDEIRKIYNEREQGILKKKSRVLSKTVTLSIAK